MKRILAILAGLLVTVPMVGSSATEIKFKDCLVPRSEFQVVSLGSPLAKERLGHKTFVRLGVLPFSLNESDAKEMTAAEKGNYFQAASDIARLSNGLVRVEFVFFSLTDSKVPFEEAKRMIREREDGWNLWDLNKSTYGLVREVVKNADPKLDYSNLDGLVLENRSGNIGSVAEAFQFFREPPQLELFTQKIAAGYDFLFHKSINTNEGIIDNAVLMGSHYGTQTILHELLHNFGLTDLYGGNVENPNLFSAMSSDVMDLLNYEKAVLGWFPLEQIRCYQLLEIKNHAISTNPIRIDDIRKDQIFIIQTGPRKAHIVEIRDLVGVRTLIMYELDNDARPSIDLQSTQEKKILARLTQPSSLGIIFVSSELQLLIHDIRDNSATFYLAATENASSSEFETLKAQSLVNREQSIAREVEASKPVPTPTLTPTPTPSKTAGAVPKPIKYKNCTALNKVYPGGVAKSANSKNKGSKIRLKPVTNSKVYGLNVSLDRDKDGLACER